MTQLEENIITHRHHLADWIVVIMMIPGISA